MADEHSTTRVRLATPADADAMISVVNAAFAIETFLDGTRTDHERMAEIMQRGEFLLAESAGRVVGCVYTEHHDNHGYFGMLAVAPDHQGRGISRILIEAAENHCQERGCRYMDIKVLSLRPELPGLYKRLGYVQIGTEEFRPSRPLKPGFECHCIVMSKPLQ